MDRRFRGGASELHPRCERCQGPRSRWNEEVQRTVPEERLLVFEVRDGWEPLCRFLGVDVPDKPFPRANDGASFEQRISMRGMAKSLGS
jgi:hypothetical protein